MLIGIQILWTYQFFQKGHSPDSFISQNTFELRRGDYLGNAFEFLQSLEEQSKDNHFFNKDVIVIVDSWFG